MHHPYPSLTIKMSPATWGAGGLIIGAAVGALLATTVALRYEAELERRQAELERARLDARAETIVEYEAKIAQAERRAHREGLAQGIAETLAKTQKAANVRLGPWPLRQAMPPT
jgi:hypothetical protein